MTTLGLISLGIAVLLYFGGMWVLRQIKNQQLASAFGLLFAGLWLVFAAPIVVLIGSALIILGVFND